MPNQRADPLGDIAARVVAEDPDLQARVKRLVNALLRKAEHTVRFGSDAEVNALMKQVIPTFLRSMPSAAADAAEAEHEAAYERMKQYARGEIDAL